MEVENLYCPLCGDYLDWVNEESKPQQLRCNDCGMGWEVLVVNNSLMLSQAPSLSKPELKVIG